MQSLVQAVSGSKGSVRGLEKEGVVKAWLDLSAGSVGGSWRCVLCVVSAGLAANTFVVSTLKVLHTGLSDVGEGREDGDMTSDRFCGLAVCFVFCLMTGIRFLFFGSVSFLLCSLLRTVTEVLRLSSPGSGFLLSSMQLWLLAIAPLGT